MQIPSTRGATIHVSKLKKKSQNVGAANKAVLFSPCPTPTSQTDIEALGGRHLPSLEGFLGPVPL